MADRRVEDARPVKVDVEAETPAFARGKGETFRRHGDAARVVVGVLKRQYRRLGMVDVAVRPARSGEFRGRGDSLVVVQRIWAEPRDGGKAADLGAPHMRTLAGKQAFAVAAYRRKGKQIAHRSRAGKDGRLFSRYLRRVFAERV